MYHYAGNNPVCYTDPNGKFFNVIAAVAGGVIGAGVGAISAAIAGGSTKDVIAAAVGGALAGFTCGASLIAGAAVGAVVAAGTDIAINAVQGNDLLDGVDKAALGGGVGGGVGYVAGVAIGTAAQASTSALANQAPNSAQSNSTQGYTPKPGERTFENYVKENCDPEVSLHTKSSGFNNHNGKVGGEFKRFGANSHGNVSPHVHQPQRNVSPNGNIYGSTGSKTANGGVTSPTKKDIKQLYDYLENGKYHE